jgi:hypothetical protein
LFSFVFLSVLASYAFFASLQIIKKQDQPTFLSWLCFYLLLAFLPLLAVLLSTKGAYLC